MDARWSKWRTSSYSDSQACVAVTWAAGQIGIRDSEDPDGPALWVDDQGWQRFIDDIKAGGFARP